jgi:hypothetical protein
MVQVQTSRRALLALGVTSLFASFALAQAGDGVVVGNDVVNDGVKIRSAGNWNNLPSLGPVTGLAGDNTSCTLWIASSRLLENGRSVGNLKRLSRGDSFETVVADFTATDLSNELAIISISGLAWHNGQLIGYRSVSGGTVNAANPLTGIADDVPEGFYTINTTTGFCTPLYLIPDASRNLWDFSALDSDGTVLWGGNDNLTATPATGGVPGLYRINFSLGNPFVLVSAYPTSASYPGTGTSVRDIDGLAAGEGRVWLVPDETSTTIRPWIVLTGSYAPSQDLPTPFLAASNVAITSGGAYLPCWLLPVNQCDSIDFNGDGLFPDDQDLVDFLSVLAGGPCSTGTCNDIDFNNDQLFPDDSDLVAFLRVLAGGNCND